MVMPMIEDPGFRHHLDELYREDDRLRADHERWMARREADASPPVSKTGEMAMESTLYRVHEPERAPVASPRSSSEPDWSGWENWLRGHLDIERKELLDTLAQAMGYAISEVRHQLRTEMKQAEERLSHDYERKLAIAANEVVEIKGFLTGLLTAFGKTETQTKTILNLKPRGEVVELPRGFPRRAPDAA
jgi:hypothetical protein